jgi:hypothetical protein
MVTIGPIPKLTVRVRTGRARCGLVFAMAPGPRRSRRGGGRDALLRSRSQAVTPPGSPCFLLPVIACEIPRSCANPGRLERISAEPQGGGRLRPGVPQRYSAMRRVSPQAHPAAISSDAMTIPTARPPSASSLRLAEAVNEAWSALIPPARSASTS